MKKQHSHLALALLCTLPFSQVASASPAADVVFLVDESGSMSGEQTWVSTTVNDLESQLIAAGMGAGIDQNRYALVGFGDATIVGGHDHLVGGGVWGNATDLSAATGGLETSGSFEDGWDAINTALGFSFRPGVAKNFILITDEDRDNFNPALSFANILASLSSSKVMLNAVVNNTYQDVNTFAALGIDGNGNAYLDDGFGGFNTTTGGVPVTGFGTTTADYVDLALATGGAAWDLNILRLGGLSAEAFTTAFTAIKVQEITTPVPVPAVPALMAFGLLGWLPLRKKKVQQ